MLNEIKWIAADWGTTNLRVWAIGGYGRILAEASSGKGMAKLDRDGFEPALIELIGSWLPETGAMPVIACGMVGARQGWIEAPYRQAPCRPFSYEQIGIPDVGDSRLKVRVLPGIKQIAPADVMRGEETQIAGVLSEHPHFEGVLCLPGTHTKWVRIGVARPASAKRPRNEPLRTDRLLPRRRPGRTWLRPRPKSFRLRRPFGSLRCVQTSARHYPQPTFSIDSGGTQVLD